MNQIIEFFARSPWAIVALAAFVITTAVSIVCWKGIKFRAMDLKYTFPFFGKINHMSKSPTQSPKFGWTSEEQRLCGDYSTHAKIISEKDFKDTLEYLRLAGDIGREPMPGWAWLFISVLVLMEGYGFSYLLGTWVTRDGDINLYRVLAAFLAVVICGLMLWLTHNSGRELHRTGLLKSCRAKYQSNSRNTGNLAKDSSSKAFFTEPMSIGVHTDSHLPQNVQCANRVASHGSDEGGYWWTTWAVVAMIFIAALSFWMRQENLNREIIKEGQTVHQEQSSNPFENGAASVALHKAKAADSKKDADAALKAQEAGIAAQKSEGGAAFAMLSGIFLLTQIVSVGLGMKYGFAGKQGKQAYENTNGFSTYSTYFNSPIFRLTQARLQTLQQKMERGSYDRQGLCKTYSDYCREEASHENHHRSADDHQYAAKPSAAEIAATVTAMGTTEEKLKYLSTILDESLRADVKTLLAKEKEAAAFAKEKAEFGDVL